MRLVCPNCDAEYEVDAAVIPDGGRDVQCSNCGHAWFQLPPAVEAALEAEEALYDAPAPAPAPPPATEEPQRRSLDESVLAVLREEAEREARARRAERPQPIETQPDLGLAPPQVPAGPAGTAVARRISRLRGNEAEGEDKPEQRPSPSRPLARRELLPEIDEINSTLRPSTERRAGDAGAVAETMEREAKPRGRSSGFRSGFVLMLLLAAMAVAAYVLAPKLAAQFPAAAVWLDHYVAAVDQARLRLDGLMKAAITYLRDLAGGRV